MYDAVFIRSERHGIERVDIFKDSSHILYAPTNWVFLGPNTGLISALGTGIVCDTQHAYSVFLLSKCNTKSETLMKIKFESQVHHVTIMHPYVAAFSSSVIEVRNIETVSEIRLLA